jgi:hypothetical protein
MAKAGFQFHSKGTHRDEGGAVKGREQQKRGLAALQGRAHRGVHHLCTIYAEAKM